MSTLTALKPVSWQRMAEGIDNVKNRLDRATAALSSLGVRYAVGLVDESWPGRFSEALGERLQVILDDPEG